MDVVEIIVAELVPHVGPIPHGVRGADIAGLLGDAGEIAVFDDVVVAGIGYALVRGIVDKAMAHAVAHAAELHRRFVGLLPAGVVVNVAVLDGVLSPRQRLAVATRDADPGGRHFIDIAAPNEVVRASLNVNGRIPHVANGAAGDLVMRAVLDQHSAGTGTLER